MENNPRTKNYYMYPLWMLAMVIVITFAMSYIPSFYIFGAESKKVDILSDIKIQTPSLTTVSGIDSMMFVSESEIIDSISPELFLNDTFSQASDIPDDIIATSDSIISQAVENRIVDIIEAKSELTKASPIIKIEDYTDDKSTLNNFTKALESKDHKNVRIAFIGDSFIEGDILSGDIREFMQNEFGGKGVGFVPITSISAKYRTTIQHSFSNWTSYTIKKKNSTEIDNKFILSPSVNTPRGDSASVIYKIARHKPNLIGSKKASLYFINEKHTIITAIINDTITKTFTPPSSSVIQEITIKDNNNEIKSLNLKFKSTQGFYAYGVTINSDEGICVDNFSERGSSGMPLLKISEKQTAAFRKYVDYNLIILQFGLNILTKGKNDYSYFENKIVELVDNMKQYYPNASIIIMGISDRSVKVDGKYVSMPEINSLRKHQRNVAKRTSVAYWDTYHAMNGIGGIQKFVNNRWAAKDHVHVNVAGARVIAEQFMKSLIDAITIPTAPPMSLESMENGFRYPTKIVPKTAILPIK